VRLAPVGGPAVDVEVAGAEVCPLRHVCLAEDDCAGVAEFLDDKGVAGDRGANEEV
jgi:hypothetical protein